MDYSSRCLSPKRFDGEQQSDRAAVSVFTLERVMSRPLPRSTSNETIDGTQDRAAACRRCEAP